MELTAIRAEIEHMLFYTAAAVTDLQRRRISTNSAEELLGRMQSKVDELCTGRDRQLDEQRRKYPGTDQAIHGPSSGASDELVRRKRGQPARIRALANSATRGRARDTATIMCRRSCSRLINTQRPLWVIGIIF